MSRKAARFISRLTHDTLAVVLAGGRGTRLGVLTEWRTKPAVPFAGKFRIIDFTLSNCINSGIRRICVLTQYKSHRLIQHILQGWNHLNTGQGGFIDVVPAQQWLDDDHWYRGTADAVYQSNDIIQSYEPRYVLVLAGDHVYNMDYGEMLADHVGSDADFTVACNPVPLEEARHFGVMQVDESMRIIDFEEKPAEPKPLPSAPGEALISMGIYVFSVDYLMEQLERDASNEHSSHDFGKDIIPNALRQNHRVQASRFQSPTQGADHYWRDVGTIDAYYQANMEIVSPDPPLNLHDLHWPVYTHQPQLPPAHFIGNSRACTLRNSMASGGCVIEKSSLYDSILFSLVKVHAGCAMQGVVALPGCDIGAGSQLKNVLLDNQCKVPPGTIIGHDPEKDAERFHITERGIVVVNREMLGQGVHYLAGVEPEPANI